MSTSLYEVEKIIGKKMFNGKPRYKVKWQGYPDTDCTWEVPSHLRHVRDMVEEFEKKLALKEGKEKAKDLSTSGVYDEEESFVADEEVNHSQMAKRVRPKRKNQALNSNGKGVNM